jgi:hypothetical protein
MVRLVGISGYAGSGKTTAADHLISYHRFERVKFAGPLKDMLRALGLREREIEGDLKEVPCMLLGGRTPRHAMITLGTEWGRDMIHPDLWTRLALFKAESILNRGVSVVIDDLRFINEYEALKAAGGTVLRISRPGVGPLSSHLSESFGFPPDHVIENSGSLDDLADRLESALGLAEVR